MPYPNLRTLYYFHELTGTACTIVVKNEGKIMCLLLPSELLLVRVGVLSPRELRERKC